MVKPCVLMLNLNFWILNWHLLQARRTGGEKYPPWDRTEDLESSVGARWGSARSQSPIARGRRENGWWVILVRSEELTWTYQSLRSHQNVVCELACILFISWHTSLREYPPLISESWGVKWPWVIKRGLPGKRETVTLNWICWIYKSYTDPNHFEWFIYGGNQKFTARKKPIILPVRNLWGSVLKLTNN